MKTFKLWYEDKKDLAIEFSETPQVTIRYVLPGTSKEEIKSIKRYPFINKKDIIVFIQDFQEHEDYSFIIHKGYCFDGASIPKAFWRVIGPSTDNTFLIAAMVHDRLCENHKFVGNNRNLSSRVFRGLLIAGGVGKIKAQIMYLAVDNFQRFCHWK